MPNDIDKLIDTFREIIREELHGKPSVPPERRYLTPAEAGKIMGYSRSHVHKMMRDGHIPFSNWTADGVWKIDRRDIERIFEKRKNI